MPTNPTLLSLDDALTRGMPLSEEQIATYLQVSPRQVRRLVKLGLPSFKVGAKRRFEVAKVNAFLSGTLPKLQEQSGGLHPKESPALH